MQRFMIALYLGVFLSLTSVASPVSAEQLAQLKVSKLEIKLNSTTAGYELVIKPLAGLESLSEDLTANVFAIENPTRVVIDIPGHASRSARTISLNTSTLSALRLGVHSDKVRLVLDVIGQTAPEYSIESDQMREALVVNLSASESAEIFTKQATSLEPPAKRTLSPLRTSEPLDSAKDTVAKKDLPAASTQTSETSPFEEADSGLSKAKAIIAESQDSEVDLSPSFEDEELLQTPKQISTRVLVNGIYYHTAQGEKSSAVMIDVDNLDMYQLSQKEPNRYELVLKNAKLAGNHLTLPQFPPDTFTGFEVILARPQGDDVVISIYVDQNVRRLSPSKIKDKLWLKIEAGK